METPVTARAAILQALAHEPAWGMQLADRIRVATSGMVVLSDGSLYPALRGLERDGYVTSWAEPQKRGLGGRARRLYRLTTKGLERVELHRTAILGLFK